MALARRKIGEKLLRSLYRRSGGSRQRWQRPEAPATGYRGVGWAGGQGKGAGGCRRAARPTLFRYGEKQEQEEVQHEDGAGSVAPQ